jgi:hypothetical protein
MRKGGAVRFEREKPEAASSRKERQARLQQAEELQSASNAAATRLQCAWRVQLARQRAVAQQQWWKERSIELKRERELAWLEDRRRCHSPGYAVHMLQRSRAEASRQQVLQARAERQAQEQLEVRLNAVCAGKTPRGLFGFRSLSRRHMPRSGSVSWSTPLSENTSRESSRSRDSDRPGSPALRGAPDRPKGAPESPADASDSAAPDPSSTSLPKQVSDAKLEPATPGTHESMRRRARRISGEIMDAVGRRMARASGEKLSA